MGSVYIDAPFLELCRGIRQIDVAGEGESRSIAVLCAEVQRIHGLYKVHPVECFGATFDALAALREHRGQY